LHGFDRLEIRLIGSNITNVLRVDGDHSRLEYSLQQAAVDERSSYTYLRVGMLFSNWRRQYSDIVRVVVGNDMLLPSYNV
jgi:hypothetical protein